MAQPTTAADSVPDLHALLGAAGVATPVVLVGHSYGGLVARLEAMTHPGAVAGMVLVDALSEGLRAAETPDEWAIQRVLLEGDLTESLTGINQNQAALWRHCLSDQLPGVVSLMTQSSPFPPPQASGVQPRKLRSTKRAPDETQI